VGFDLGKKRKAMGDINITPFVDVVLVLLIIFMITAPLMFNGIMLRLPQTKKVDRIQLNQNQVVLSLTRTGDYFLNKDKVAREQVLSAITGKLATTTNQVLYVRADYAIRYGQVAELMSFLKRGGVSNIALVTEIEKE
jgi:biopolymer transport protein ExbD